MQAVMTVVQMVSYLRVISGVKKQNRIGVGLFRIIDGLVW